MSTDKYKRYMTDQDIRYKSTRENSQVKFISNKMSHNSIPISVQNVNLLKIRHLVIDVLDNNLDINSINYNISKIAKDVLTTSVIDVNVELIGSIPLYTMNNPSNIPNIDKYVKHIMNIKERFNPNVCVTLNKDLKIYACAFDINISNYINGFNLMTLTPTQHLYKIINSCDFNNMINKLYDSKDTDTIELTEKIVNITIYKFGRELLKSIIDDTHIDHINDLIDFKVNGDITASTMLIQLINIFVNYMFTIISRFECVITVDMNIIDCILQHDFINLVLVYTI